MPRRRLVSCQQVTNLAGTPCTEGALEGLDVALQQFLDALGKQLAKQNECAIISPNHVVAALEQLGLNDLAQEALLMQQQQNAATTSTNKGKKRQWSQDLEDEQERLLAQASKRVLQQRQKGSGTAEEKSEE